LEKHKGLRVEGIEAVYVPEAGFARITVEWVFFPIIWMYGLALGFLLV
jgi:hypothetical protein